jgi:hypothetical protein
MKHPLRVAIALGAIFFTGSFADAQSDHARLTLAQEEIPLSKIVDRVRELSGANILYRTAPEDEVPYGDIVIERIQLDNAPWRGASLRRARWTSCSSQNRPPSPS